MKPASENITAGLESKMDAQTDAMNTKLDAVNSKYDLLIWAIGFATAILVAVIALT